MTSQVSSYNESVFMGGHVSPLLLENQSVAPCPVENPIGFLACSQETGELVGTTIKAVALGLLILFTIFGNVLVLMSVAVSRNLRSSTHYLIVNLAVADLLLGTTVLPFSAAFEVTGRWYFGQTFCTIWAAVDVLCCTSSILSLCVISLDRYIGVTRPLAYSTIMVGRRTSVLIVVIWAASIAISIGPLLGWKEPPSDDPYFCTVNKQLGYVLFSVTGSFYLPMFVIIGVYWKIYKAALRQTKFLECGQKTTKQDVTLRVHLGGAAGMNFRLNSMPDLSAKIRLKNTRACCNGNGACNGNVGGGGGGGGGLTNGGGGVLKANSEINIIKTNNLLNLAPLARPEKSSTSSVNNEEYANAISANINGVPGGDPGVVLRIHRGGGGTKHGTGDWTGIGPLSSARLNGKTNNGCNNTNGSLPNSKANGHRSSPRNGYQSRNAHQILTTAGGVGGGNNHNNHHHQEHHEHQHHTHNHHHHHSHNHAAGGSHGGNSTTPSPPSSSPERKLNTGFGKIAKFRRQKKAAKTLAIVVGVFLVCWFPFFFVLPLGALCEPCKIPDWMFQLFFWLGYFNSCLNPIIYGCTSREFQRAFRRILCRRSPPRPHLSRAIYRANMLNNNRFAPDRHSNTANGNGNGNGTVNNGNVIPLNHWG